jgi:hypothetical protein
MRNPWLTVEIPMPQNREIFRQNSEIPVANSEYPPSARKPARRPDQPGVLIVVRLMDVADIDRVAMNVRFRSEADISLRMSALGQELP